MAVSHRAPLGLHDGDEVYLLRVMPGKKGDSVKPMKKRTTQNPTPLVMAGMQIVPMLQHSIMPGRKYLGSLLASNKLPGNWPIR